MCVCVCVCMCVCVGGGNINYCSRTIVLPFLQVWPKHITKAQIKVLLSLLWYMIYGLILLLALSTLAFVSKRVSDELTVYLYCESTGVSPGKECDRSGFEENEGVYLFAVQVVFGTGYHFINLMYALNIDKIRKLFSRHRWRGRNIK